MEKRYQVFISSTYADLKDERRAVIQMVVQLDCIPAGMELFPAADDEQLAFIKRMIDDCDYYLLIIGGRYGSVDASGLSYTEQEYDYAVSHGLKIIALIHDNPDDIPLGKSEKDPALRARLQQFKTKVSSGRLVKFWSSASELPGLVAVSLTHAMKAYPATGWIRANTAASVEVLTEINELRKQNAQLRGENAALEKALADAVPPKPPFNDLAGLDEAIRAFGKFTQAGYNSTRVWGVDSTWREIFGYIAPYLVKLPNEISVKQVLGEALFRKSREQGYRAELDDQFFQTVGVQLKALGLVRIQYSPTTTGAMALFWSFTNAGERLMLELRTVRTKNSESTS
jgi:hypothetical protein